MAERRPEGALSDRMERVCLGVAASGGLILAACLSALPAATCDAMALTYSYALRSFGFAAFCALVAVAVPRFMRTPTGRWLMGTAFASVAVLAFVGAVFAGAININSATYHCYGSAKDRASTFQLRTIITWWKGNEGGGLLEEAQTPLP